HEGEVEADDDQPVTSQHRFAPDDRLVSTGGGTALFDPLGVGLRVFEAEDVLRRDPLVLFSEGTWLHNHRDPFGGAQPEVVAAAIADTQGRRQAGGLERGIALGTGKAIDLFADAGTRRRQSDITRFRTKHWLGCGPDGRAFPLEDASPPGQP